VVTILTTKVAVKNLGVLMLSSWVVQLRERIVAP
jgi:hypothetical protein